MQMKAHRDRGRKMDADEGSWGKMKRNKGRLMLMMVNKGR